MTPRTAATAFRIVAVAEALSWVGLLAGMFVKYVPETTELGVQVFGPIHGAIFVAYVVVALVAARVLRWDAADDAAGAGRLRAAAGHGLVRALGRPHRPAAAAAETRSPA